MRWKWIGSVVAGAIALIAAGGWVLEGWLVAQQPSRGKALIENEFSDGGKDAMSKAAFRQTLGALLLVALTAPAHAGEVTRLGPLEIDTPWARASIGTARPGAAYVTVRNTGAEPDRLVGIETPVATRPEVHAMDEEGGVMKMRPAGPLEIPPGGDVRLEPGGMHIMLMQLQEPLQEGEHVPITLIFEKAGEITVSAPITSLAARTPPE